MVLSGIDLHALEIEGLRKPSAYRAEGFLPGHIEVVETHVSHLFLTSAFVYKVKKPINLGFVDATTLEKRRSLCERELAVNRRFSPAVYLGVMPVTLDRDGPALGGEGEIIDYAVKMRRLPAGRMLNALLERNRVSAAEIRGVAIRLAALHAEAPRSDEITRLGGVDALRAHLSENFESMSRYVGRMLDRQTLEDVEAYSDAFMWSFEQVMRMRGFQGFVRDGHGDLHAAQICLADGIQFIDAIEFDSAYRCGDTGLDVAFLAMDLDRYGHEELSKAFVDAYIDATKDDRLRDLIGFFKCYRACVRAKVTSLRAENEGLSSVERRSAREEARSYYRLARRYALDALPRPALYLIVGLSGSGKSTVARALAARWGLALFSSDVERRRLFSLAPDERVKAAYGVGVYSEENREAVYTALLGRATCMLEAGESVVLDATFGRASLRNAALGAAVSTGAEAWVLECVAPPAVVEDRLRARAETGHDASDADIAVYRRQAEEWEAPIEVAKERRFTLQTTSDVDAVMKELVEGIFGKALSDKEVR